MRIGVRLLSGVIGVFLVGGVHSHNVWGQNARPTIATEADFRRAMKELSNWGRWGEQDELGAANLITPAKRKQALALAAKAACRGLGWPIVEMPNSSRAGAPNASRTINCCATCRASGGSTPRPM